MPDRTCELPDCEKPRHQGQRYCGSHYMKKYRYGDPYYQAPPKAFRDVTGHRFGELVALSRDAESGQWLCRCDCGTEKHIRIGDLRRGTAITCGDLSRHEHHNRQDVVTYHGAHDRVERLHGRAKDHPCVICGQQANDWAYDHTDPDELVELQGTHPCRYSVRPEHYQTMCRRCHLRMDRALARRRRVVEQGTAQGR